MKSLEGALCAGQWWLFDSTDKRHHALAKALCDECPVTAGCRDLLALPSHIDTVLMPTGTWAGKLYGKRGNVREVA